MRPRSVDGSSLLPRLSTGPGPAGRVRGNKPPASQPRGRKWIGRLCTIIGAICSIWAGRGFALLSRWAAAALRPLCPSARGRPWGRPRRMPGRGASGSFARARQSSASLDLAVDRTSCLAHPMAVASLRPADILQPVLPALNPAHRSLSKHRKCGQSPCELLARTCLHDA